MKLLVISDTHGNYPLAIKVADSVPDVDAIVHLGDETEDADILEMVVNCPVIKIAGNCDRESRLPRELSRQFDGMTIFMTHGDAYNVKGGLHKLVLKSRVEKADVVLYGHTHTAAVEVIDEMHFINPGTLHPSHPNSYATVTITERGVETEIVFIPSAPP